MKKEFMFYAINDYAKNYEGTSEMDECRIAVVDMVEKTILADFRYEEGSLYFFEQGLCKGLHIAGIDFKIDKLLISTEKWAMIKEDIERN